jgi:hypothetical protein
MIYVFVLKSMVFLQGRLRFGVADENEFFCRLTLAARENTLSGLTEEYRRPVGRTACQGPWRGSELI